MYHSELCSDFIRAQNIQEIAEDMNLICSVRSFGEQYKDRHGQKHIVPIGHKYIVVSGFEDDNNLFELFRESIKSISN